MTKPVVMFKEIKMIRIIPHLCLGLTNMVSRLQYWSKKFPLKEDFWLPYRIVCPGSLHEVDTNQWAMWRRRDSCLLFHYHLQEFLGKEGELPDSLWPLISSRTVRLTKFCCVSRLLRNFVSFKIASEARSCRSWPKGSYIGNEIFVLHSFCINNSSSPALQFLHYQQHNVVPFQHCSFYVTSSIM